MELGGGAVSGQLTKRLATSMWRLLLVVPQVARGVRWLSRAVESAPAHSLLGRLRPMRALLSPSASGQQVLAILETLDELQVRYWLAGGWGIDALTGRQNRGHHDVDIVLDDFAQTIELVVDALASQGFRVLERDRQPNWMPDRWLLGNAVNCHLELVSLDVGRVQSACSSEGCAFVHYDTGTIEGCAVPCLSAEAQRIVHGGYQARPSDHHDLALLEELCSSAG